MAEHRRYTKRQKVSAVTAALASNAAAAAEATGIPERNIRRWRDDPAMAELVTKTREQIAEDARLVAQLALEQIVRKLPQFEGRDLVTAYGVLIDKAQLLAGQPTARTETRELGGGLEDHERAALSEAIDEWLAARTET